MKQGGLSQLVKLGSVCLLWWNWRANQLFQKVSTELNLIEGDRVRVAITKGFFWSASWGALSINLPGPHTLDSELKINQFMRTATAMQPGHATGQHYVVFHVLLKWFKKIRKHIYLWLWMHKSGGVHIWLLVKPLLINLNFGPWILKRLTM